MTDHPTTEKDSALEGRLRRWLVHEAQVEDERRLVRADDESILVSKFPAGFAPALHALLERLPSVFDEQRLGEAYADAAGTMVSGERVEAWDRAVRELLRHEAEALDIEDGQQGFVRVGIDSVRALLESVLWSAPRVADDSYAPLPGERSAYLDATRRMAGADLFTRRYGVFEERLVENHCPGAAFARVMLAQAWTVCTGTPPPTEPSVAPAST
jgi:hypothetical protein